MIWLLISFGVILYLLMGIMIVARDLERMKLDPNIPRTKFYLFILLWPIYVLVM